MSASEKNLKPQDILFEEGDQSSNLYVLRKGVIRIFKRKSDGNVELETIRAGQLIGELAFLDNQTRSASAEAVTSCELIEIPRSDLDEAMAKLPEWFVALTKTITGRLRAANNKIRTLEGLTMEYGVDRHGNRSREYTFVNTGELLKFSTALLIVASRYGKPSASDGIEISGGLVERFAGQILQVNSSKIVHLLELFKKVEILKGDLFLTDIRFLDQLIQFLNDQNLLEPAKKMTLSNTGYTILSLIYQNRTKAVAIDEKKSKYNVGPTLRAANLDLSQLQELYDQKFILSILVVSGDDVSVEFENDRNLFNYRAFSLLNATEKLNESQRKA